MQTSSSPAKASHLSSWGQGSTLGPISSVQEDGVRQDARLAVCPAMLVVIMSHGGSADFFLKYVRKSSVGNRKPQTTDIPYRIQEDLLVGGTF